MSSVLYDSLVVGIVVCFICHTSLLLSNVSADNTLAPGYTLFSDGAYFLESSNKQFRLKFVRPVAYTQAMYLCIQLITSEEEITIWVARPDKRGGVSPELVMDEDKGLVIKDGGDELVVNDNAYIKSTTATLLDTGNLVLQSAEGRTLWQSFYYPTNTWLPGMKLGWFGLKTRKPHQRLLTSWIADENPYPGAFTLGVDPNNTKQLVVLRRGNVYWQSGVWNGNNFPFQFITLKYFSYFADENDSYFVMNKNVGENSSYFIVMYANGEISGLDQQIKCDEYYGDSLNEECVRPPNQTICGAELFNSTTGVIEGAWEQILFNHTVGISDCKEMCVANCSCNAYAAALPDGTGCKFSSSAAYLYVSNAEALHISLGVRTSPVSTERKPQSIRGAIIAAIVVALAVVLAIILVVWRMNNSRICPGCFKAPIISSRQQLVSKENEELPFFDFKSIEIATNYFSDENKLGQGGFGPVYKGILPNGQEIAAKRLSRMSGQGIEQFKNEVLLISKLQHKNLVRLLGCCTQGDDERILIYEYLPNKSLDSILFDTKKKACLDWRKRVSIIDGIAQGLLYLHKYSRLKIIHRDLKTSNILLDIHMHSKISDFGTARIFKESDSRANTKIIVGTYGYMSPEYAMDGCFSKKSDIFSFGVTVMEIVIGKRNNGFYNPDRVSNLLGYVWELWIEGRVSDIIDPTIDKTVSVSEATRFIQIGLLCVQDCAADRPTMSDVVSMFGNESMVLPIPKQPGFSVVMGLKCDDVGNNLKACSNNVLTISEIEGR